MKFRYVLICLGILVCFPSCLVTESIVFNEDGSGEFLVTYDLSGIDDKMDTMFGPSEENEMEDDYDDQEMNDLEKDSDMDSDSTITTSEKPAEKAVDTLVYFDELMIQYKDSISQLPEKERKAIQSLKGMYMSLKSDDANDIFEMGVGIKFKSIDDLKDIQKRVETAKSINSSEMPIDSSDENSPVSQMMNSPESDVTYSFSNGNFSRKTTILNPENSSDQADENEELDEMDSAMKEAVYYIKYTFPKKIKSVSVKDAEISEDGKTVSFYASWTDYIKNPLLLDVEIELEDE